MREWSGVDVKAVSNVIPVIIPSYEPDERLIKVLHDIMDRGEAPIVLVDDGSGEKYSQYFEIAQKEGVYVLHHDVNKGKGAALKTAFSFCIDKWDNLLGCVTADSDGQHSVSAIFAVRDELVKNSSSLILGVRDFSDEEKVPAKSRYGNNLTRKVFQQLYKMDITDTQTGLRGIPADFMKYLCDRGGNRFEFETQMLIYSQKQKIEIVEIPIETIYDSKTNHSTHFHPVMDSIKIYSVFIGSFVKFVISSLSSSIIDLGLFALLCHIFRNESDAYYIYAATLIARIVSSVYNYTINYVFVFKSGKSKKTTAAKYFMLAVVQLMLSAILTKTLYSSIGSSVEILVKIPVDLTLFLISYLIQKKMIY